ncbi:MAG TPA: hypothetical protein VEY88_23050 [Archangium sp.]|nr:hypothetical protein [Archangium sp.]
MSNRVKSRRSSGVRPTAPFLGGLMVLTLVAACSLPSDDAVYEVEPSTTVGALVSKIEVPESSTGASVLAIPQVRFLLEMDQLGPGSLRRRLESLQLFQGETELPGTLEWSTDKRLVLFNPAEALPPDARLRLVVKVRWEGRRGETWVPAYKNGKELAETVEHSFWTRSEAQREPLIKDVTPVEGTLEVSGVTAPTVQLAVKTGKPVPLPSSNGKPYRAKVDVMKLYQGEVELAGTVRATEGSEVVSFEPTELLQAGEPLRFMVQAHWEKEVEGTWKPVMRGGSPLVETRESRFTARAHDASRVLAENVVFSYPVARQYHFLKFESHMGSVQLLRSQARLFQLSDAEGTWQLLARFSTPGIMPQEVILKYDEASRRASFGIPPTLFNEKIYTLSLVKVPADGGARPERLLHTLTFRTSRYDTFMAKLDAARFSPNAFGVNVMPAVESLALSCITDELFDKAESHQTGLVQAEFVPRGNVWYEQHIEPLIYRSYVEANLQVSWRDVTVLGFPPLGPSRVVSKGREVVLTDAQVESNSAQPLPADFAAIYSDIALTMHRDYQEILEKASPLVPVRPRPDWVNRVLSSAGFPHLRRDTDYTFILKYVLPDGQVTSQREITARYQ